MEGAVTVATGDPKTPTAAATAKTAGQQPQLTAAPTPMTS